MATATRIPIEQYLRSSYEPDAEFVRGEIEERSMGEYDHNLVQWAILDWFHRHDKEWQTRTIQEQRTRLNSDTVRIPDVSVWARTVPVEPVFSHPQLIVVEVYCRQRIAIPKCRRRSRTTGDFRCRTSGSSIRFSEWAGIVPTATGCAPAALPSRVHPSISISSSFSGNWMRQRPELKDVFLVVAKMRDRIRLRRMRSYSNWPIYQRFAASTLPVTELLHLKWQYDIPTLVAPPLQDASAG
jgi:hypothetical protein